MVSKIEQITEAESKVATLADQERTMRSEFMADGVIDTQERASLDRINGKITQLEQIITQLRTEYEENLRIWRGRAGAFGTLGTQVQQIRDFGLEGASDLQDEYDQIQPAADDQRWADATTLLDQALVTAGPLVAEYDRQNAAMLSYQAALPALTRRLVQNSVSEFQSLEAQNQQIVDAQTTMEEAAAARDFAAADEQRVALSGILDTYEVDLAAAVQERDDYQNGLAALQWRIDAAANSEMAATADAQQQIMDVQSQMQTAAESQDFVLAIGLLTDMESALQTYEGLLDQRDLYTSRLAAIRDDLLDASVSRPNMTYVEDVQAQMVTAQGDMETAAEAEDYDTALQHLAALEGHLVEYRVRIDAEKAAYLLARIPYQYNLSTIAAVDIEQLADEKRAVAATEAAVDAAADVEDWVAAKQAIADAQPAIRAFNDAHAQFRDIETDVVADGQIQDIGGIQGVGPAIILEEETGTDITGHLQIAYELKMGNTRVAHGTFRNGGTVERDVVRGEVYTLTMRGHVSIYDPNWIMNNTSNGQMITVNWRLRAPLTGETGADPSVEIIGAPEVRPTSGFAMTDGRTEWNIAVNDISSSRTNSSQLGLYIKFNKGSSSGYQGSIDVGAATGGYSAGAQLNDTGALSVLLRMNHVDPEGD